MNNNVKISAFIRRDKKKFGELVREYDIVTSYDSIETVKENDQIVKIPEELLNNKYIYLLCAWYTNTEEYGEFIPIDNIVLQYYSDEQEAELAGCTLLNKIHKDFDEYSIKELNYVFSICKIYMNRHDFKTYEEKDKYYKENFGKMELPELLIDLAGGYKLTYYDYNGNILVNDKVITDHYNTFSFKSLEGYHADEFEIGDEVRFKYYNDRHNCRIVGKYEQDSTSIYNSNDPYHYKQGYNVEYTDENGYTTYNENWEEPYFDEDLERFEEE